MSNKKKIFNNTLLKSAGTYTLANFFNAAIPFILLPVLTNYLSTEDYGILTNFLVLLNFTMPFVVWGTDGAITRQYIDKEKVDFPKYFSNVILIIISGTVLTSVLFFIFNRQIVSLTGIPGNKTYIILILSFITGLTNVLLAVWRAQFKAFKYSFIKILKTSIEISLSVLFVILIYTSWISRIYALLIATIFTGLLIVFFIIKENLVNFKIDKSYIKDALSFGTPLIPHTIGGAIIAMSDRIFITKMVGISDVGIYAAGYQIAAIILLLQDSFNQAYAPWLFTKLKENNHSTKIKIVKFTYAYDIGIVCLVLLLTFASPLVVKIFLGKDFYNAQKYIFWLGLALAFNGMYKMVVNYLFYLKKTRTIGPITLSVAGLNIVLNYFFIKNNGPVGAAQATCVSFFALFVFMWIVSAKMYKMPWLLYK